MQDVKKKNQMRIRRKRLLRRLGIILGVIFILLATLYSLLAFSNIPFFAKLRHVYIETAMSTMRHQWLATAFFPDFVVEEVMGKVENARENQIGIESTWTDKPGSLPPTQIQNPPTDEHIPTAEELSFFQLFYELDPKTVYSYLESNPKALENGWENIYINEAGLDDEGTSIRTKQGDSVLAVDAENGIVLIRVTGTGFRGVLAIAKDPSKLSVRAAETLGTTGQYLGTIVKNNGGVLGITANAFEDYDQYGNAGKGNGGILSGFTMCNGVPLGEHMGWGYKRIELREDNLMYIVDTKTPVHEACTDAVEFTPALIVDGKILVDEYCGWNAINPRACIGQSARGEIMMLAIEGRQISSLGVGVVRCAEILKSYDCMQALNLDGGTSAIMWYRGECVIRCCNLDLPYGRPLPNAFVYAGTM